MNYNIASIPADYPAPTSSTDFDPKVMSKMFDEGVRQTASGMLRRTTPPGLEPGEGAFLRVGTDLQRVPLDAPKNPIPPPRLFPRRDVTK